MALNIYHCAWGKVTYDNMLKAGISEKQICITGSQRLDYIKPKFKKLNLGKDELARKYGLDHNKKWILMVGNFSAKDEKKFDYLNNAGYSNFKELHQLTKKTYFELLNWYQTILNDPNLKDSIELIYRPHPNEIIEKELVDLANRFASFHIIGDLTISDWAINIDMAYIWTSTSAIEISVANVPIISLVPYKLEQCFEMMLIKYIEKIDTVEKLIDITKKIFNQSLIDINGRFKKEISDYYQIFDVSSSEKIVSFINKIFYTDENIIMSKFNFFKGILKFFVYIGEYILYRLNISTNKYLTIRFRDYRTDKFIIKYCNEVRYKIFE